jgi:hypothetical protein
MNINSLIEQQWPTHQASITTTINQVKTDTGWVEYIEQKYVTIQTGVKSVIDIRPKRISYFNYKPTQSDVDVAEQIKQKLIEK